MTLSIVFMLVIYFVADMVRFNEYVAYVVRRAQMNDSINVPQSIENFNDGLVWDWNFVERLVKK